MTLKIAVLNLDGRRLAEQWPRHPPDDLKDVVFQFDDADGADHIVALNGVKRRTTVHCEPDRVWMMVQEPPEPQMAHLYGAQPAFSRVYLPDATARDERSRPFWGALEPHIGKTHQELLDLPYPHKTRNLVWVTSAQTYLPGHRRRIEFLTRLVAAGVPFELWGRGFRELPVKWDVLSTARYAIAHENHGGGIYWSEKLSDCFLAYTTPFYFGASNIDRYFPPKSYVPLNPDDPHMPERMRDIVASRFHEENRAALEEARELCLTNYNTLVYIAREVSAYKPQGLPRRRITLRAQPVERAANRWYLLGVALRHAVKPLVPSWALERYRKWRQSRLHG